MQELSKIIIVLYNSSYFIAICSKENCIAAGRFGIPLRSAPNLIFHCETDHKDMLQVLLLKLLAGTELRLEPKRFTEKHTEMQ